MFLVLFYAVAMTVPTQIKVIAVSGTVYGILQALKQIPLLAPYLKGWWAVGLNVALSIAGVLAVATPGTLENASTWIAIFTAALGAAGIHGTVLTMTQPNASTPDKPIGQAIGSLTPAEAMAIASQSEQTVVVHKDGSASLQPTQTVSLGATGQLS